MAILLGGVALWATDAQDVFSRNVIGTVLDARNRPLSSAIVYLHNLQTHRVRTYICDHRGHYRFSGLKSYDDYEIHAEHDGMTSDRKTISRSEMKKVFVIDLKCDQRK
ncbi:MAG TPA: carboxypeptidase-like regulatory domain-containing protein [Candidatus Bathyarchaeia archaeon]|nr:carboxypeptidase-like regulatory domain-containing protein [Candidatus Bathyarchaeia archaeon]